MQCNKERLVRAWTSWVKKRERESPRVPRKHLLPLHRRHQPLPVHNPKLPPREEPKAAAWSCVLQHARQGHVLRDRGQLCARQGHLNNWSCRDICLVTLGKTQNSFKNRDFSLEKGCTPGRRVGLSGNDLFLWAFSFFLCERTTVHLPSPPEQKLPSLLWSAVSILNIVALKRHRGSSDRRCCCCCCCRSCVAFGLRSCVRGWRRGGGTLRSTRVVGFYRGRVLRDSLQMASFTRRPCILPREHFIPGSVAPEASLPSWAASLCRCARPAPCMGQVNRENESLSCHTVSNHGNCQKHSEIRQGNPHSENDMKHKTEPGLDDGVQLGEDTLWPGAWTSIHT